MTIGGGTGTTGHRSPGPERQRGLKGENASAVTGLRECSGVCPHSPTWRGSPRPGVGYSGKSGDQLATGVRLLWFDGVAGHRHAEEDSLTDAPRATGGIERVQ